MMHWAPSFACNQTNSTSRSYVAWSYADIIEACWKFIPVGINGTVIEGHDVNLNNVAIL